MSFAVSMLGNGLLSLVADGIGGVMRKRELANRKPQIVQVIQRQYDQLFVSSQKTMTEVYQKMGAQAKQHLAEFYNSRLQMLERQVEQSAAAAHQDNSKKEEIRRAVEQLRGVLNDVAELI